MVATQTTTTASSSSSSGKNLWIAASDGDLPRVQALLDPSSPLYLGLGWTANSPDPNSYTPMHAAASYAHIDVLDWLISNAGGDVNVTDEDGDTPLFTVESVAMAQALVERGANPQHRNHEGQTAAEYLFEDGEEGQHEVAIWLQSVTLPNELRAAPGSAGENVQPTPEVSSAGGGLQTERLSSALTDDLLSQTEQIMRESEMAGEDPEERLRALVGGVVMEGWRRQQQEQQEEGGAEAEQDSKRQRGE